MKYILPLIILFIPIFSFGQYNIQGIVTENKEKMPITYATVYLNGTTKGTYTNDKGYFTIQDVTFPCLLVVSCIGYETQSLEINNPDTSFFSFQLKEAQILIPEITIEDKNRRDHNIKLFREHFLGMDKYGENAVIKNEEALIFNYTLDTIINQNHPETATKKLNKKGEIQILKKLKQKGGSRIIKNLNVVTTSPLIIELPLLGYSVTVDFIKFIIYDTERLGTKCDYLGYYFFKHLETDNSRKLNKYKKERRKVYYNSSMHFGRSLYNNQLKENGFIVVKKDREENTGKPILSLYDFSSKINENGQMLIKNLKGQSFQIYYCEKNDNPINLEHASNQGKTYWQHLSESNHQNTSQIYFSSDTCYIRANGSTPDHNIMFSGYISRNKIGSILPEDYDPE